MGMQLVSNIVQKLTCTNSNSVQQVKQSVPSSSPLVHPNHVWCCSSSLVISKVAATHWLPSPAPTTLCTRLAYCAAPHNHEHIRSLSSYPSLFIAQIFSLTSFTRQLTIFMIATSAIMMTAVSALMTVIPTTMRRSTPHAVKVIPMTILSNAC